MQRRARIGLISDTHGLLRPEALAALRESDRIVHAGDIGGAHILEALQAIAPVTAAASIRRMTQPSIWSESRSCMPPFMMGTRNTSPDPTKLKAASARVLSTRASKKKAAKATARLASSTQNTFLWKERGSILMSR